MPHSVNELDPVINVFLKQLEARVGEIDERSRNYSNLLSDEQDALKRLKGYWDIVIKEADKGGAVVVWGRSDSCEEAYRQLHDNQVYELIHTDPPEKVKITIAKELEPLLNMGYISPDNKKYLEVSSNIGADQPLFLGLRRDAQRGAQASTGGRTN